MANVDIRHYAATREDAEALVARIKQEYHPSGYGTFLRIDELVDPVVVGGKTMHFYVSGSRQSSCD